MVVRIAGVDQSLTSTAVAVCEVGETISAPVLTHFGSEAGRGDDIFAKCERLRLVRNGVAQVAGAADVVLIENVAHGAQGNATRDLAGLFWMCADALVSEFSATGIVSSTVVKKFATGNGAAKKAAVTAEMGRRWPETEIVVDDDADALALMSMGLWAAGRLPWQLRTLSSKDVFSIEWSGNLKEVLSRG